MRTQLLFQMAHAAPAPLPPGFPAANTSGKMDPGMFWAGRLHVLGVANALSCGVVFGSPRLDCAGTGICRLETTYRGQTPEKDPNGRCRASRGFLAALDNGSPALILPEAFLCARVWRIHLCKGLLVMENACPIPATMRRKLGLSTHALPAGIYPLQRINGMVTIKF